MTITPTPAPRCSTGIEGLDLILGGGYPLHRFYLIQGDPGVGKTTLALQFLRGGAACGERGLYITLSETRAELLGVAQSHGWDLNGFEILDLSTIEQQLLDEQQNTVFPAAEVELNQTIGSILERVEAARPTRIVFDSMSEMRLLAQSSLRFRRQMLALKQHFIDRSCSVLFLDDNTSGESDRNMQSLVHGVIQLEQMTPEYGNERRRLRVVKMRGAPFAGGWHDYAIETGGMRIFPRLVAAQHHRRFADAPLSTGNPRLDSMVAGGLDRGTSTLFIGPAGTGKSSFAALIATAAAERGEKAAIWTFDESLKTMLKRMRAIAVPLAKHIDAGRIHLQQIDPAELSPGQFAHLVRESVEVKGASVVVIDSLNGYLTAMAESRQLALQLHELLAYLSQLGVVTVLTLAQHGMVGAMQTPIDVTYIADTVFLLRYFEHAGQVKRAISAVKKRSGGHEREIREYRIGDTGIDLGEPLREFHGVLTGVPTFHGDRDAMLRDAAGRDAKP
ncbi:MAG TPA: ATPase domain-containing protein [Planctomycetota bacterium]|nr:ATPase domain-containing protein [Planctomycetota bacterium]